MTSRHPTPAQPLTPISVYVLLAMADAPLHGYGIIKHVEAQTAGGLVLEAGTLYAAIKRLHDDQLIEVDTRRRRETDDARRRYYRLTSAGRRRLRGECDRMAGLLQVARQKKVIV